MFDYFWYCLIQIVVGERAVNSCCCCCQWPWFWGRGGQVPIIWSGGNTNVDVPKFSACCVLLCIMVLWYNDIIDFSPKSEASAIKLGQSQVLANHRHSGLDPKLCDDGSIRYYWWCWLLILLCCCVLLHSSSSLHFVEQCHNTWCSTVILTRHSVNDIHVFSMILTNTSDLIQWEPRCNFAVTKKVWRESSLLAGSWIWSICVGA